MKVDCNGDFQMTWKETNDMAFALAIETTNAVNMARELVRDAKIAATAKVRSVGFTQCRGCQALLENFMIEYPDCSDASVQSYLEDVVFLDCTPCTTEYNAMLDARFEEYNQVLDKPSDWEKQNLEVAK